MGNLDETPSSGGAILSRENGATIAYNRVAGKNPGVVFLHGFHSDRTGEKAKRLESFCRARGQAYVRFDAFGHGESSGAFEDGTIGRWAADAVAVLDHLTQGPQVLVGSSMGGWLMVLAALARPNRVVGLMGLAAAPDFVEELIHQAMTEEQKRRLLVEGRIEVEEESEYGPFVISRALIEEARNHLVLSGPIALSCPVRLIHGQKDTDVPCQTSLRLAEALISTDVEVTLVKKGEHRLSEPEDLDRMTWVLGNLLDKVERSAPGA